MPAAGDGAQTARRYRNISSVTQNIYILLYNYIIIIII